MLVGFVILLHLGIHRSKPFGLGLLPGNPTDQAFATPDVTNGLLEAQAHLLAIGGDTFTQAAATNYYLCMHYAIYSKTIPEQRG